MRPLDLWAAGYTDLISIIPPGAPISPASKIDPSQAGKVPGRRNANGTWGGYDWRHHETTEDDVRRWVRDGANVGLRTARFPQVDIDATDPQLVELVTTCTLEVLGPAPIKVGRAPKRCLMYRTDTPFPRMRLFLDGPAGTHLIELLGDGQQTVVDGIHPLTGHPYTWLGPVPAVADLTAITPEKVALLFDAIATAATTLGYRVRRSGDGQKKEHAPAPVQSDLLAPSLGTLRDAVDAIPNTDDLFPDRDAYVGMAYAIKAAAGQAPDDDAFDVFASWAARHVADARVTGNAETWRADWRRCLGPFRRGWPWIAETARRFGWSDARDDFPVDPTAVAPPTPPPAPPVRVRVQRSDRWLADQIVTRAGDRLRYVPASGTWYAWDGTAWVGDEMRRARTIVRDHLHELSMDFLSAQGITTTTEREARRIESARCMADVTTLLQTDPRIAVPIAALDADPWLLSTPGGVVDLRTGLTFPPDPKLLMTRRTSVAPDSQMASPEWDRYLLEATGGDLALRDYLQRWAGYCLTGSIREHAMVFVYGVSGTGKSRYLEAIREILSLAMDGYAFHAPMESFTESRADQIPTDLASMAGRRLVTATETQAGRRWNEQRVKALTGADPISARFMRRDFFVYIPQFKLLFAGNDRPAIHAIDDSALRRRIHVVPFPHRPAKVDLDLPEKLKTEYPAILAWMVRGTLAWREYGLRPPPAVERETEEYFAEEDAVARWIGERCERVPGAQTELGPLYESWREWCGAGGEWVGTQRRLAASLRAHGFPFSLDPATRRTVVGGLTLRPITAWRST